MGELMAGSPEMAAAAEAPAKPVPFGKDREAVAGISIMTASNDSGGGLLHNMAVPLPRPAAKGRQSQQENALDG